MNWNIRIIFSFQSTAFKAVRQFNPIQDGHFRSRSRMGVAKKSPLPNMCHPYPIMMKLGTVIPYLKKIQKIYESRDTTPELC